MNCEEYREALTADPAFDGGASHMAECRDCQAYSRKLQALNLEIAKALQLDVPDMQVPELPEIDSENVTVLPTRRRSTKPVWFAVAASMVLATSIAVRMSGVFQTYDSLGEEILAHLDHEPAAMRVTDAPVSDQKLQRAVPASLAVFNRNESLITYAQSCVINGYSAPHLVIQGQHGPVTIILLPNEKTAEATPIDGDNVRGIILPVGDGSIAIIGDREEALEPIQENVINSVTWTT